MQYVTMSNYDFIGPNLYGAIFVLSQESIAVI